MERNLQFNQNFIIDFTPEPTSHKPIDKATLNGVVFLFKKLKKMQTNYIGISEGKIYDLQNVNFTTMNGLCDIEGYNRPQWCLFEKIISLNTPLAKSALSNVLQYKEHATPNQLERMLNAIKEFDIDLNGCGFYAIQAKLKLEGIRDLTLTEFQAICKLFKE